MLAIDIQGLTKTFPGGFTALNGIDLQVEEGEFLALLGANGAGKTTTIQILCSLMQASSGEVRVFGHALPQEQALAKCYIGLVPQEFNCPIFEKPIDILISQAGFYGLNATVAKKRGFEILERLDLADKAYTQSMHLSGGMKRRLLIARALVNQPKIVILDEPTAGVDIEIRHLMWDFFREINQQGTTIVLTTHYLEEAEELCRHITMIKAGKVVKSGTKDELLGSIEGEVLVITTAQALPSDLAIEDLATKVLGNNTLEVHKSADLQIGKLIDQLEQAGLQIQNIRNKRNRLEQLFLNQLSAN